MTISRPNKLKVVGNMIATFWNVKNQQFFHYSPVPSYMILKTVVRQS